MRKISGMSNSPGEPKGIASNPGPAKAIDEKIDNGISLNKSSGGDIRH